MRRTVWDRRTFLKASLGALSATQVAGLTGCSDASGTVASQYWVSLHDAEEAARAQLTPGQFRRRWGGDAEEALYEINQTGLHALTLRPRVLVGVSDLDLSISLLGQTFDSPIIVGPGSPLHITRREQVRVLRGATTANTAIILHGPSAPDGAGLYSGCHPVWYQFDPSAVSDSEFENETQRALKIGASTIVYTPAGEDTGRRKLGRTLKNIVEQSTVPVVLNGVMTTDQAEAASQAGASGVIVTNRYIPRASRAAITALPEIAHALGETHAVLLDGGIRRGTDVLKALAMGAHAVLVGRPVRWALAAAGSVGVRRVLELLESELALSMALCGQPGIASIDSRLIRRSGIL